MSTVIEIREASYFSLDADADLTPDPYINDLLEAHVFELDLATGDLTPTSIDGDIDEFFEWDSNGDITPKILN